MHHENKKRSIIKTASWRTLATFTTALIVYLFTGELILAISIGSVEVIVKIVLYFFHERAWNKINYGRRHIKPFVVWFTGLSGSGKSTLASKTYNYLKRKGLPVHQLNGDVVQPIFPNAGISKEDRIQYIKRAGHLASLLEKNNVFVIASFITPYQESRDIVRNMCDRILEIHVNASLETCEERDPKNLYKRARAGEINNFTGIDDPYETPLNPEISVNTNNATEEESFGQIKKSIDQYLKNEFGSLHNNKL